MACLTIAEAVERHAKSESTIRRLIRDVRESADPWKAWFERICTVVVSQPLPRQPTALEYSDRPGLCQPRSSNAIARGGSPT